jgi:2-methylcitrate dehydratase PrpD
MTTSLALERFAHELAEFARDVTDAERTAARRSLADALACAVAGAGAPAHRRSRAALDDLDSHSSAATVWFTGTRSGPLTAAYLNSVAVSAHDLDDGHRGAVGHPGGAVIPAVLTELELSGATVDLLGAVVVGYEAAVRIAEARDLARVDCTATGRWAGVAAAAASWFVHGDRPETLVHALAHAGSLAPQLSPPDPRAVDGVKEGTPWATVTGLIAARLARSGIPGPVYLLERHREYGPANLPQVSARHPGAITQTYFKRYACCRWIHPALDCLFALHEAEPVDPDAIVAIEVATFERSLRLSNRPMPLSIEDAHYSFPFCLGLAATGGPDAFLPIRDTALTSAPALRVADRVTLRVHAVHDAAFPTATPATVRIRTTRGTREMSVSTAMGDPGLPFSTATLRHKHRRLIAPYAPALVDPLARLLDDHTPLDVDTLIATVSQPTREDR